MVLAYLKAQISTLLRVMSKQLSNIYVAPKTHIFTLQANSNSQGVRHVRNAPKREENQISVHKDDRFAPVLRRTWELGPRAVSPSPRPYQSPLLIHSPSMVAMLSICRSPGQSMCKILNLETIKHEENVRG